MQQIISLDTIKNGDVMQRIQKAFQDIVSDVQNLDKPAEERRAVTIKMTFDPTPDRAAVNMKVEVKTTLGKDGPISGLLFFERKGKIIIAHDEADGQGRLGD